MAVVGCRACSGNRDSAALALPGSRKDVGRKTGDGVHRGAVWQGEKGKGCQGGKAWDRSPQDPGDGAVNDHMEGISASLPIFHNHFHADDPILNTEVLHQRPSASKGVGNCVGLWGGLGLGSGLCSASAQTHTGTTRGAQGVGGGGAAGSDGRSS